MAQLFQAMLLEPWMSRTGDRTMKVVSAKANQNDLVCMRGLLEAGKVIPVIDKRYPLNEAPEASGILEKDTLEEKSS